MSDCDNIDNELPEPVECVPTIRVGNEERPLTRVLDEITERPEVAQEKMIDLVDALVEAEIIEPGTTEEWADSFVDLIAEPMREELYAALTKRRLPVVQEIEVQVEKEIDGEPVLVTEKFNELLDSRIYQGEEFGVYVDDAVVSSDNAVGGAGVFVGGLRDEDQDPPSPSSAGDFAVIVVGFGWSGTEYYRPGSVSIGFDQGTTSAFCPGFYRVRVAPQGSDQEVTVIQAKAGSQEHFLYGEDGEWTRTLFLTHEQIDIRRYDGSIEPSRPIAFRSSDEQTYISHNELAALALYDPATNTHYFQVTSRPGFVRLSIFRPSEGDNPSVVQVTEGFVEIFGNIQVNGNATFTGNVQINGNLNVSGNITSPGGSWHNPSE